MPCAAAVLAFIGNFFLLSRHGACGPRLSGSSFQPISVTSLTQAAVSSGWVQARLRPLM